MEEEHSGGVIGKYLRQISGCFVGNFYWKDKEGRYLGSNESALYMSGKKIEVIGKTDFDIWPERAEQLRKNDLAVMEADEVLSFEETIQVGNEVKYYAVLKVPMKDDKGNIIGVIGNSVDITERKELEALKRESEEQSKINEIVGNLVHDIRTPLLILENFTKICGNLTEKEHVILRDCIFSIQNLVHSLLSKYRNQELPEAKSIQSILVPQTLSEIVFRRKFQKKERNNRFNINFKFNPDDYFTFIRGNASDFERMMDNLINNAVEALEPLRGKIGTVEVLFDCDEKTANIIVRDNGVGMPKETAEKLMKNQAVSSTKKTGHGIGTRQVQSTLKDFDGHILIETREGVGTKVILNIPRAQAPAWSINCIEIFPEDVVVILDDDTSVHNIWRRRFEEISHPLRIEFFSRAQEALDFVKSFSPQNKLLLLFDYEMRDQELSGLDVILQSGHRGKAVLVSSAYGHIDLQNKAVAGGIKIVPKAFIEQIPIIFRHNKEKQEEDSSVDAVLVDDDDLLIDALKTYLTNHGVSVHVFRSPVDFLDNVQKYDKNTKIVMDNDFKGIMSGAEFAHRLYDLGYKKLYVFSGMVDYSSLSKFPSCIDFIPKASERGFENLLEVLTS